MPNLVLRHRRGDLHELMDDPACDPVLLRNTYRQFYYVNGLLAGWRRVYRRWIRPALQDGATSILDIGCGGGDLVVRIARWAKRDGLKVIITAADPEENAISFLNGRGLGPEVKILQADTSELIVQGRNFDIVVSNHVLHHLPEDDVGEFLRQTSNLASRLALHSDIRRDDLAFAGFLPIGLFFRRSFILSDGLRSIRRSFLPEELAQLAPDGWHIESMPLFRNLAVWRP